MRITRGRYFALIVNDRQAGAKLWHWIVQRKGSSEVLGMGQERSQEDARLCAERCITNLLSKDTRLNGLVG